MVNNMGITNYKMSKDEYKALSGILEKRQSKKRTQHLKKLRCAIYARKSQQDITDTSLDAQINYCKEVIDSCDILELTSIYQEDNVSGFFDDRAEFQKMIAEILDKKIDVVVLYSIDRFSRNSGDTFYYHDMIIGSGAYLLQADSSNVINSAESLLTFQVKVLLGEFTGRQTAEKTYIALRNKVHSDGVYMSGCAPFGYVLAEDGKLELELDESLIVSDIFEQMISGHSLGQIATNLNSKGIKTKQSNTFTKTAVKNIITNQIYTGTYVYDKGLKDKKKRVAILKFDPIVKEDVYPAIVSKEMFDEAQKMLKLRESVRTNDAGHIYLLSGLLKCINCGRVMIGSSSFGR